MTDAPIPDEQGRAETHAAESPSRQVEISQQIGTIAAGGKAVGLQAETVHSQGIDVGQQAQQVGQMIGVQVVVQQATPATARKEPDPETIAAYLAVMRAQCGLVETRPYRQLAEVRGAAPRFSLLDEGGRHEQEKDQCCQG